MEFTTSGSVDELYALALKHRDNKVDGFSADESILEAEKLFLQLADNGNSKAMHNFASIQHKKGNYEKAFEYWSKSGLPASAKNCTELLQKHLIQQDLYLVVGSERTKSVIGMPVWQSEFQGGNVDLTHTKSFNGRAVTMDIQYPSQIPGASHIFADASTFDFAKYKYNIKHVLLERLPTASYTEKTTGEEAIGMHRKVNVTGNCILNIAKYMQPGAILEIEWDPYTSQVVNVNEEERAECAVVNPFNGYMSFGDAVNASSFNYYGAPKDDLAFTESMRTMAEIQKRELIYYCVNGMNGSIQDLMDRIYWEFKIVYEQTVTRCSRVLINYHPVLGTTKQVVAGAEKFFTHYSLDALKEMSFVTVPNPNRNNEMTSGYVFQTSDVLNLSLMTFVNNSISARSNAPHVKSYLERNGFAEVTIERRTNDHNGKRHCWMVRAIKT